MNSSIVLSDRVARKHVHNPKASLPRDPRFFESCSTTSFYVQSLLQNYTSFRSSGVVARLMYNSGGDWIDFEESVVERVRNCFVVKSPVLEVEIGGGLWLFDFCRMLGFDFDGGVEVSVGWIDVEGKCWFPKFVVGGDFQFSGFRDRGFGGLSSSDEFSGFREGEGVNLGGLGKLEIEIGVTGGEFVNKGNGISVSGGDLSIKGNEIRVSGGELLNGGNGMRVSDGDLVNKRKRERAFGGDVVEEGVKSVGSCSDVDEIKRRRREVTCSEMQSRRWMRAKVMGEGGMAGMVVRNLFLNWGGIKGIGAEITGVHQITRSTLVDRARYEGFLNQVEITKAARGRANVTYAWIKCSSEGVERILSHGFSSPEKASLGEAFGVGIYLSPIKSSRISVMPPEAGENHVILCRLILGKCEKVEAGSQQLYPSSPEFDTGVDDVSNPKWYIVWGANMNTHILPECIVSYKHTRDIPGQLSTLPLVGQSSEKPNLTWLPKVSNAMTAKFFANLIRSLPSSKVPELRTLCCTYKAGKVPKGIFMKKLRSVVGDQMLRTAIQEVRG